MLHRRRAYQGEAEETMCVALPVSRDRSLEHALPEFYAIEDAIIPHEHGDYPEIHRTVSSLRQTDIEMEPGDEEVSGALQDIAAPGQNDFDEVEQWLNSDGVAADEDSDSPALVTIRADGQADLVATPAFPPPVELRDDVHGSVGARAEDRPTCEVSSVFPGKNVTRQRKLPALASTQADWQTKHVVASSVPPSVGLRDGRHDFVDARAKKNPGSEGFPLLAAGTDKIHPNLSARATIRADGQSETAVVPSIPPPAGLEDARQASVDARTDDRSVCGSLESRLTFSSPRPSSLGPSERLVDTAESCATVLWTEGVVNDTSWIQESIAETAGQSAQAVELRELPSISEIHSPRTGGQSKRPRSPTKLEPSLPFEDKKRRTYLCCYAPTHHGPREIPVVLVHTARKRTFIVEYTDAVDQPEFRAAMEAEIASFRVMKCIEEI
jgi:hypothetical protein